MPEKSSYFVIEEAAGQTWKHLAHRVGTGRQEALNTASSGNDVQVIVQNDQLEHSAVGFLGIIREAVSQMAIAAFGVRVARFFLNLFARHYELGVSERLHFILIRMTPDAPVAGVIAGVEISEEQNDAELRNEDRHARAGPEEPGKTSDLHMGT